MTNSVRKYGRMKYSEARFQRVKNKLQMWLGATARKRVDGMVTADDVHLFLNNKGFTRKEVYARLALANSVLREPFFQSMGQVPSTRPVAKGRAITEWRRAK